jgi:hypothetical protein
MEIARFLKVARSIVNKMRVELEASKWNVSPVAKRKKHAGRLDRKRTPQFIQQVQNMIDDSPERP